jgi:hypothetical protein
LQTLADTMQARSPEGDCRVFTRFAWGEYVEWTIGPRFKVFLDGRTEIYPDDVWQEYTVVTRGRQDWNQILKGYKVRFLVLDRSGYDHDLLPWVGPDTGWQEIATAGDAVLFERTK